MRLFKREKKEKKKKEKSGAAAQDSAKMLALENRPLRVVGVSSDDDFVLLKEMLGDPRVNLLGTYAPDEKALERIVSLPMDALVFYPRQLDEDAVEFLKQVFMARGRIGIFLLWEEPDAQVLSAAMACGVTDVVNCVLGPEEICGRVSAGVERLRMRRESVHILERDSRVVCFYGTKGGCGKSSLSVNVATCLQKMGKRCVVVDLDLQFGDVADLLNVPRFESIADLAAERVVNTENISNYLFHTSSGVEVLCAPHSPEQAELVQSSMIERIIMALRCDYDYIVFDLSSTLDDCTIVAMELSDQVYFVMNPEIPSLRSARTCFEVLAALGLREKTDIVLNKADRSLVTPKDVESTLKTSISACISCDSKNASLAINRGIPVVTCAPRSAMSKDLRRFAKQVMDS